MRARSLIILTLAIVFISFLSGCSQDTSSMKDGYYTAETAEFDEYGWKEYITIYVRSGKIITIEYDSFNTSGFVKSWDIDYMRVMKMSSGTYPSEYSRAFAVSLINCQDPAEVDAVSGATHSHITFQTLAEAVINKAKAGDKQVALVGLKE